LCGCYTYPIGARGNAKPGAPRTEPAQPQSPMAFVASILLCAALPELPEQYVAQIAWAECGNASPCVKPADHRITSTDGKTSEGIVGTPVPSLGDTPWHEVTVAASKYSWHDHMDDCTTDTYDFPIQSVRLADVARAARAAPPHAATRVTACAERRTVLGLQDWAWLGYNSTRGPKKDACPDDPSTSCELYEGPWPEQVTSLVKLWVRTSVNGAASPASLEMTCSMFPFTIYKNYTNITSGAPPSSAYALDKSCQQGMAPRALAPPRSREEAMGRGRLGRYTSLLRKHMATDGH
jgi:hypothetical protein